MPKSRDKRAIHVALLNAHYSANLGDGLLSSCLKFGLNQYDDRLNVYPVDLAARKTFSTLGGKSRGSALKILSFLPRAVRYGVIRGIQAYLAKTVWRPYFERELAKADCAILGGGNLITDQDLNFPAKISLALSIADSLSLPVYIYGVGVGGEFSRAGRHIFTTAFRKSDLRSVTVRDLKSKENWDHFFAAATRHEADIVLDPGLLSAHVWKPSLKTASTTSKLDCAIGIMSPEALSYHQGDGGFVDLKSWYMELIDNLVTGGAKICLFSNGSPEDTQFLKSEILGYRSDLESFIPTTPAELAHIIQRADCTVAFRLHALIPAVSYRKKVIALEWDQKVRSFMIRIGQEDNCFDVRVSGAAEVANRYLALANSKRHTRDLACEADAEIAQLAQTILTDHSPNA